MFLQWITRSAKKKKKIIIKRELHACCLAFKWFVRVTLWYSNLECEFAISFSFVANDVIVCTFLIFFHDFINYALQQENSVLIEAYIHLQSTHSIFLGVVVAELICKTECTHIQCRSSLR